MGVRQRSSKAVQAEHEAGTLSPLALDAQSSSMHFYKMPADGKPEPRTACFAGQFSVQLHELQEYFRYVFFCNSYTGVFDKIGIASCRERV